MFLPSLSHLALTGADNNGADDDETEEDENVYPPPDYEEKSQRAMMDRLQQEEDEEWGRRYDLGTQGRNREDRVNRRAQEKEDAEEEARALAARPPPPTAREARDRERRLRELQREAAEKAKRERAEQEERAREQRARLDSNPSRYSAQRQFDDALNKLLEGDDEDDDLDRPIVLNRRAWQAGPDAPVQPPAAAPAAAPAPAEPEVVLLEDSESEELLDEGQLPPPPKQDAPSTEWRKVNRRQPPAPDQPRRRTIPSSVTGRASGTDLKAQRQGDARRDVKVRRVTNLVSEGELRVKGRMDGARNLENPASAVGDAYAELVVGFMYVLSDARSRDYFVYKVANNSFLLTMWRNLALKLRVLAGKLMASGYFFPGYLLSKLNLLLENAVLAESSKKRCDTPARRTGMGDELADLAEWIEDNVTEIPDEFEDEAERDNDADDDAGVDGDAAQ